MRNPSRMMIGLLLGAVMISPVAAQAQERGRDRGDRQFTFQRGGQERGGADRGAQINGDSRRAAIAEAREAQRAVERPAPMARPDAGESRRQWQTVDRNRGGGEQSRRDWQRGDGQRNRDDAGRAAEAGRQRGEWNRDRDGDRRWDRNRDGDRTVNRGDRDRRWDRDGDGRHDGDRRWTSDRRDWNGRDWDRRDNDRWDRNWRNDRRYSWQNYRNHNRHIYRLPRYQAHHGYNYRRWYPGHRFNSFFYSSSYWINDPFYYRLPPAYGPYRWIRYFDDVVLVDTRDGEIIDIIYSFFL